MANGTKARPGKGFPMKPRADLPPPLQNVRSVSVASNAVLRTETAVTLYSIKVDSAGAGTMDGFTFAPTGTLDVAFAAALPSKAELPGTYLNCEGIENLAGWRVNVNGEKSGKYRANVSDGKIIVVMRGLSVVIR